MTLVLYIARDKKDQSRYDLGSALCLRVVDLLPADAVELRDCDVLRDRPTWLTGTPTLVAASGGQVLRGYQALAHLQRAAVEAAERRGGASSQAKKDTKPPPRRQTEEARRPERPATPPGDGGLTDDLWESHGIEGHEEVGTVRKMTSDDMANAMRAREQQQPPASTGAPPPPPAAEDD